MAASTTHSTQTCWFGSLGGGGGGGGGDPLAACTTHSVGSTGTTNDLWFNLSTVLGTGHVQDMLS